MDAALRDAERAKALNPTARNKKRWIKERCRANLHWAEGEDLIVDWIESPEGKMVSFWCYGCCQFIIRYFWVDEVWARKYFKLKGWDFPTTEVG